MTRLTGIRTRTAVVDDRSPAGESPLPDDARDRIDRQLIRQLHKQPCHEIQERLVRRHERLVWSIAWRYQSSGEPIEDLAQEGFIGLIRAMERYDCSSPAKFSSYAALKITGCIEHYLRDRSSSIRQPGWIQELLSRIHRERYDLARRLRRPPTLAEIADALGVDESKVARALDSLATRSVTSLDEPVSAAEEDSPRLADVLANHVDSRSANNLVVRLDLENAIARLDDLHRHALWLCFYRDMTFEEAGGRLGLDRHRARRVVTRAVRMLREELETA